jgi:hypothetical protein
MRLFPVPPEYVDTVFTILAYEVDSIVARSNGRFERGDLAALLKTGEELFSWVAVDDRNTLHAIVLAEVRTYPRVRVCRLVGCAGRDRKQWLPLLSEIERWAASIGCTQMHAEARKGWAGELPDYKLTHIILEKDLPHVERRIESPDSQSGECAVERSAAVSH